MESQEGPRKRPPEPVDVEWLAAVLLAAGADPWANRSDGDPLGPCLTRAMDHHLFGLVVRMMDMPGAPAWKALAEAPVPTAARHPRARESWLHAVAASKEPREACLAQLLAARPEVSSNPHPLARAFPWALAAYDRAGQRPTDPALGKSLLAHWRQRLKSKDLSVEEFTQMEMGLSGLSAGDTAQADQRAHAAQLVRELGQVPWGSAKGTSVDRCTVATLQRRGSVAKGALAGEWTLLAAAALQHLRGYNSHGVSSWTLDWHLEKGHPARAGDLQAARGFDWRPGVAIDGLLVLSLGGMAFSPNAPDSSFLENMALLGVDDGEAWATEHLPAALAFTRVLAGSATAAEQLSETWGALARRFPRLLETRPDVMRDVVRLLEPHPGLDTSYRQASRVWAPVLGGDRHLSPLVRQMIPGVWTDAKPPVFADLPPAQQALAVEVAFLLRAPAWTAALIEGIPALPTESRERVQGWLADYDKRSHTNKNGSAVARLSDVEIVELREAVLSATLPQAPTVRSSRLRM